MSTESKHSETRPRVSIGIFAWNEEKVIAETLAGLFKQTVFEEFARRSWTCEIICLVNGCNDATPEIAGQVFAEEIAGHPFRHTFSCKVENIRERGKLNAWNQFVHALSARTASCLMMMDADISLHLRDTLWRMIATLDQDHAASVSVDRPRKHIAFKTRPSPAEQLSLAMASLTSAAPGQLCGQLYCIRSEIARNIYLPKDLGACEDGFIKALVCTDFLSRPVLAERIRVAEGAEHTFEAYTSPAAIFRNQKRQMIGQTVVHILMDQYLPTLSPLERLSLAETLRNKDKNDPPWLKRLISSHLERIGFWWRLYPGLLTQRFKHLRRLSPVTRVLYFPAVLASAVLSIFTSRAAWRSLKAGATSYWPKAPRTGVDRSGSGGVEAPGFSPDLQISKP